MIIGGGLLFQNVARTIYGGEPFSTDFANNFIITHEPAFAKVNIIVKHHLILILFLFLSLNHANVVAVEGANQRKTLVLINIQ